MEKVTIGKNVLVALSVGLLLSLLAVAFLAGRESARPAAVPVPAPTPTVVYHSPEPPALVPTTAPPSPAVSSTPTPRNPVARVDSAASRAVAAYFSAIDNIQPGQLAEDDEGFAEELVNAAMNGDTSGFDKLIHQTEEAERKVKALVPPEPCRSYHQATLKLCRDSMEMLRKVKHGMASKDTNALLAVNGEATELKSRSEALDRQAQSIKRRYGL